MYWFDWHCTEQVMKILLATIMLLSAVPCAEPRFDTAFEYYQYAQTYFNANNYVTTITGITTPSVGKPQVVHGVRQRLGDEHFFQNVVLGASTLGKNPSGAIQRFRDNNTVSYRTFKPKAPKKHGDIVSIDFKKSEWKECTPEEYLAHWKKSPEDLTSFKINADTPSTLTREKNGNVTATFSINFSQAKDFVDNIKASSNIGVKSGDFTLTITFDGNGRAIKIIEAGTFKMNILTNPTVTASTTETIKYKSVAPIISAQKSGVFGFAYEW